MKETFHPTAQTHKHFERDQPTPEIGRKDTTDYLRGIYEGYSQAATDYQKNADDIRHQPIHEAIANGDTTRHRQHSPEETKLMEQLWNNAREHGRVATAADDIADVLMADAGRITEGFEKEFYAEPITPEVLEKIARQFDAKYGTAKRVGDPARDRYAAAAELARLIGESFPRVAQEVDDYAKVQAYMKENDSVA